MISAMVRTMQMLARWAANPRIIASETAKTRIAMLHPAWLGAPSALGTGRHVTLYSGPAERFTVMLSGMWAPGTRRAKQCGGHVRSRRKLTPYPPVHRHPLSTMIPDLQHSPARLIGRPFGAC